MRFTSPLLSGCKGVAHGFFTRKGGVSGGIYASLNCGRGSADGRANVEENRARVAAMLGASGERLLSLYQVHGADVVRVNGLWNAEAQPRADAMVTNEPGIALGIVTADCVPVLFADARAGVIGAAHAGWKGAAAGVLQATLDAMTRAGATRADICASIGPAIAQPSYEVGGDLRGHFMAQNAEHAAYFTASATEGRWFFDLKGYVRDRLSQAGIASINMLENNTYLEEDDFFSFRRATHRGETDYGRQISAIMLTRS